MKYRKILLFILILFFILILHNNCNAIVIEEGGIPKYYLADFPEGNSEFYDSIVFLKDNNTVLLIQFYNNYYIGYDRANNLFRFYKKSDKSVCTNKEECWAKVYTGALTQKDDKFICSGWTEYSFTNAYMIPADFTNCKNYSFLYGTTKIYPCFRDYIITDLNGFANWSDDIVITSNDNGNIGLFIPQEQHSNYVYSYYNDLNGGFACYRPSIGSSEFVNLNYYQYNTNTLTFDFVKVCDKTEAYPNAVYYSSGFLYINKNFYNNDTGEILVDGSKSFFSCLFENNYNIFPSILNSAEDLSKGNDDIVIMPGDFTSAEDIRFVIQKVETVGEGNEAYERHTNIFDPITLNVISDFYRETENGGFFYVVPWSFIKDKLVKDTQYIYVLSYTYKEKTYTKELFSTFGGLTESDIIQNSIDNQTKVFKEYFERQELLIKEQTTLQQEENETSKGIWGTLKEVLSYINPFSENFFVYKLIELLINALKSLFIPADGFLDNYFNELKEWFSARLGFLSYPLDLILNVLERIKSINFEEPIIQIPDFVEPSTNEKIINARTYNLNSLLENNTFKTCHDVYLVLVDAIIIFGLVNLLKNKMEEVFTK